MTKTTISFFEEFPTKSNLNKLKLINFPTKLYLAAESLNDFLKLKKRILKTKKNKKLIREFVYWPILEINEGYWISSFAKQSALKRIFNELKNTKTSVMLDLELPTTKNPKLYITQLLNFPRNKSLIKRFIREHAGKVYLAEYYPEGKRKEKILGFLGLHYKNKRVKLIKMLYHSLHPFDEEFIRRELKLGKKEYKNNYLVAYGTIAKGISGNEPILSPEQLEKDLRIAKETGIKEVIIYRLGGLNKKYSGVIKKFI